MSNTSRPHVLQHTRLPCPSSSPGVCSNSCPLSQRKYMRLKVTVYVHSWGKFWTKDEKTTKKAQLPLLKSLKKKQGTEHAPCTIPPKMWAYSLSRPSALTPRHYPSPYIRNKVTSAPTSKQGNLLFVLTPHACSWGPSNTLPGFLVWPLISFC